MGLRLFEIHLGLRGFRLGYLINALRPYLLPDAQFGFIMIAFSGELIFMLWLLAKGWKIQESR